jgi:release factor glutamine methyltransferase
VRVIPALKDGVSVTEATQLMAQAFSLASIEDAGIDARALICHALRIDRARLLADSDRVLEAREVAALQALAARRLKREPVSRIRGRKEFWNLMLEVTPAVLTPRPETETVVEAALDALAHDGRKTARLQILDIGTGSGCLLLALLSELSNATGLGTDISESALEVARANAERNGLQDRCSFVACDIVKGIEGAFDLIVSNPPYVAHGDIATLVPEVRDYAPQLALDGGADGLACYRAIARQAPHLMADHGRLIVELGAGQEAAVRALLTEANLRVGAARADLAGIPRALSAEFRPQKGP